jgi:multisubunit Na+/H+ antiporter MnhC subunit
LCVGIGIYLLGKEAFGNLFIGIGFLVAAIGVGVLIAGYLYPKTSQELTNAVDEFEKR